MSDERVVDMDGCARCDAEKHTGLKFKRLEQPMVGPDGTTWRYWASCPTNGDPIMMRVVEDRGGRVFACKR